MKTVPREYDAENENIDLLKLKSFIGWHQMKDKEMTKPDAVGYLANVCSKLYPLNVFLRNALT